MARLPRLTLPGHLHHVILRGNNRQPIFHGAEDFQALLALLVDNAQKYAVAVHAYVLMDNHFHLLVTPASHDGLPQMMQVWDAGMCSTSTADMPVLALCGRGATVLRCCSRNGICWRAWCTWTSTPCGPD